MDAKAVINLGLAELGATVSNIDPPVSTLEKHVASGYPQWKKSELTKRRWVFANKFATLNRNLVHAVPADYPYAFDLPGDQLRLIRAKGSKWIRSGDVILHTSDTLAIEYTADVPEHKCDALFIDALALRVAMASVEKVTQSNVKASVLERRYKDAIREAGVQNALIIGPENDELADEDDTWHTARYGYGV
jgi:hypothetical protein